MHKLLFSLLLLLLLLLLTIVATAMPAAADEVTLSAVRSANFTGSGLSYLAHVSKGEYNANLYLDIGACRRDGGGTGSTGVYIGASTLLRQISLGGRTRSGVGWFSPGNQWQVYAAYDVKF